MRAPLVHFFLFLIFLESKTSTFRVWIRWKTTWNQRVSIKEYRSKSLDQRASIEESRSKSIDERVSMKESRLNSKSMWLGQKNVLAGGCFYRFPAGGEFLHLTGGGRDASSEYVRMSRSSRTIQTCAWWRMNRGGRRDGYPADVGDARRARI